MAEGIKSRSFHLNYIFNEALGFHAHDFIT